MMVMSEALDSSVRLFIRKLLSILRNNVLLPVGIDALNRAADMRRKQRHSSAGFDLAV